MSTAPTPAGATATMHSSARWDGRLVGREEQLAELGARFERVVAERSAACVLVTGDPGSGRSRLVRAFVDGCGPGTRSLTIACDPTDAGGSRWPLAGLVEAFADLGPAAASDDVARRLGTLFEGQPDADRVVPQLLAMLSLDGRVEADEVRWALRRAIEAATRDTPTIVHIDDADRAGAGFVRLLADVAASSHGAPILFVLTSRRESDAVPAIRLAAARPRGGRRAGRRTPRRGRARRRRRGRRPRQRGSVPGGTDPCHPDGERHARAGSGPLGTTRRSRHRAVAGQPDRRRAAPAAIAARRTRSRSSVSPRWPASGSPLPRSRTSCPTKRRPRWHSISPTSWPVDS